MAKYYRIELDCDIYIKIVNRELFISIPAYFHINRTPFKYSIENKVVKFVYYKYIISLFLDVECKFANVKDGLNGKNFKVHIWDSDEEEYNIISQITKPYELLNEPYACLDTKSYNYTYNTNVKFLDFGFIKNADLIEKIINVVQNFVMNISHVSCDSYRQGMKAERIFLEAKKSNRVMNCRNMAVVLNAIFLSKGFLSRYIVCMSKATMRDSHFLIEVYYPKLKKWIAIDSSYALLFYDENNRILSIRELRNRIALNKNVIIHFMLDKINEQLYWNNIVKKLYKFRRCLVSTDHYTLDDVFIELLPSISCKNENDKIIYTDNPDLFWR